MTVVVVFFVGVVVGVVVVVVVVVAAAAVVVPSLPFGGRSLAIVGVGVWWRCWSRRRRSCRCSPSTPMRTSAARPSDWRGRWQRRPGRIAFAPADPKTGTARSPSPPASTTTAPTPIRRRRRRRRRRRDPVPAIPATSYRPRACTEPRTRTRPSAIAPGTAPPAVARPGRWPC